VWLKRKNKLIVFSFFFFMINLALVMQLIPIGGTLESERYTYVPYIGMAFLIGILLEKYSNATNRNLLWRIPAAVILVFCIMTFFRTKVWKNSGTLWTDVIKRYPNAAVPRTNRANYLIRASQSAGSKEKERQMLETALEDCTIAIKAKPNHAKGYENRENIYLRFKQYPQALADANMLIKLEPQNRLGYYTKGFCYQEFDRAENKSEYLDSAIYYFNKCLEIDPRTDFALNNRGTLKFNRKQQYDEAIADFTKAISINPAGNYYLNRSKCYYKKGDVVKAKSDLMIAIQKNEPVEPEYRKALNL
jgi:tetratricopeptide (TPR) repeat protein